MLLESDALAHGIAHQRDSEVQEYVFATFIIQLADTQQRDELSWCQPFQWKEKRTGYSAFFFECLVSLFNLVPPFHKSARRFLCGTSTPRAASGSRVIPLVTFWFLLFMSSSSIIDGLGRVLFKSFHCLEPAWDWVCCFVCALQLLELLCECAWVGLCSRLQIWTFCCCQFLICE